MEESKRPLTDPEIYRRVTVSTGHIPLSVDQALHRAQAEHRLEYPLMSGLHFEVGTWAVTGDDGYWDLEPAYIKWGSQDIQELVQELEWGPSGLHLLTWAFLFLKVNCLRLDSSGPVMDGLEVFEW